MTAHSKAETLPRFLQRSSGGDEGDDPTSPPPHVVRCLCVWSRYPVQALNQSTPGAI